MKSLKTTLWGFLILSGLFIAAGCTKSGDKQSQANDMSAGEPTVTKAIAVLHPTAGNNVSGTVTFTKDGDGIRIIAEVKGLPPGKHGFHIHKYGDCSAADGTSAAGHFNPENVDHGGPDADVRHVGDLGNIETGADSTGRYDRFDNIITFSGTNSIIGRAVVVHAGEDDLVSQPTGNAGARVACGVIGIAKEQ